MIEPAAEEAMQADIFVIIWYVSERLSSSRTRTLHTPPEHQSILIDQTMCLLTEMVTHIKKGASEGMKGTHKQTITTSILST